MKKLYMEPVVREVELQAKENIAANPISAVDSVTNGSGGNTTVYNMALFGDTSFDVAP